MKSKKHTTPFLAFVFALALCFGPTAHASENTIKSAGCKTESYLIKDLSDAYKQQTGRIVLVGSTGNKTAVKLLQDGKIDFAFTCKPIDKIAKKLQLDVNTVGNWKSVPIAIDPIVVMTHPEVGVSSVTSGQLAEIFAGTIDNWKSVGGKDLLIKTAYMNPELESGVVMLFQELLLENKQLDTKATIGVGPDALVNFAAITPGAITFVGHNSFKEKFGRILAVDGIMPTEENILSGKYALAATYYFTMDGTNDSQVADFVKFALSEEGKKSISKSFIPYRK